MKAERFVLFPGYITSKNDGQRHFVGIGELKRLYLIPASALCVTFGKGIQLRDGDVECRPRRDGKYPALNTKEQP